VEDNSPGIGLFWIILARSFWVFTFPISLWFLIFNFNFDPGFILAGLILNSFFLGLLIERLFYLRKKKSKSPPVPTAI
jgi:hypothetical protein